MNRDTLLSAVDIAKAFGPTKALVGVSAEIAEGEVVAIMGPSGCGKSTFLLCLAGILTPDGGTLTYKGRPFRELSDLELSELRLREFGFVFQFGQLVPELTALDNVALPLRLADKGRKEARREALAWLERLGVADLLDRRQGEMSGGEAQRVALARALATGPRVLFADEPTGSLDSANGEMVMTYLMSAAKDSRAAVVLVTHDDAVASHAGRTIHLRDGANEPERVHT